jgi:hypothetical protein
VSVSGPETRQQADIAVAGDLNRLLAGPRRPVRPVAGPVGLPVCWRRW